MQRPNLFLIFLVWMLIGGPEVAAQVPGGYPSGVRALLKPWNVTHVTDNTLIRKTLMNARRHFTGFPTLLKGTRQSVVQVSLPKHTEVLGTGSIVKARDRSWIVMPYHLAGSAGGTRTVRVMKRNGKILESQVTIALNGTAGWHSPDVSLAELPAAWEKEVTPLEIAPANMQEDVYSVGYVAGELNMNDLLPVKGRFIYVDRENMLRKFHIYGVTLENPVSGNGYCGSALMQKINGEWKIVGMHNGHTMNLENPSASVGSSVNLFATLPQLIDNYDTPIAMSRGLVFRGWEITRLGLHERVNKITVLRTDETQEPIVRYLRNFASAYSDAYAELAVGDLDLHRGDKLIFSIVGRDEKQKRVDRQVEFVIP